MIQRKSYLAPIFGALLLAACEPDLPTQVEEAYQKLPEQVDFNYHVKPILSDNCFHCHGYDPDSREADLRLDTPEGAYAALTSGEGKAVHLGSRGRSVAVERILTTNPDDIMPPPDCGLVLSDKEKAIIVKWIEQGADYKPHWSFIPTEKSALPKVSDEAWCENEIDHFVLAKLEAQNIIPSPMADKATLIRRLHLDLTGLPPTPAEVEAFVNDNSADAYEKLVDRLLASEAHAERLALEWMDVSRYADSHGLHADGIRHMWQWRDWVIDAFHKNQSYDEFVTWQLAGDLLPNATEEQILATAFNRNTPMTGEGGVVDEEFRLKYVFDKANTTGTAFMGLTMECAQCHNHKFDPISQKDYYSLAAFFNNIDELGMTGDDGNYGPSMFIHTKNSRAKLKNIKQNISITKQKIDKELDTVDIEALKSYVEKLPDIEKGLNFKFSCNK